MDLKSSATAVDTVFIRRSFRLLRQETAYLKFLIEGYDGLLFLRSIDGRAALVEISYAPSCREDADGVIEALARETGMEEVFSAPPPPPL